MIREPKKPLHFTITQEHVQKAITAGGKCDRNHCVIAQALTAAIGDRDPFNGTLISQVFAQVGPVRSVITYRSSNGRQQELRYGTPAVLRHGLESFDGENTCWNLPADEYYLNPIPPSARKAQVKKDHQIRKERGRKEPLEDGPKRLKIRSISPRIMQLNANRKAAKADKKNAEY